MVFSSTTFLLCFFPITLIVYGLIKFKTPVLRNYWLLFVSMLFFMWNQPKYWWVIGVSIVINYFGALLVSVNKNKELLAGTVTLNLIFLFVFKYLDFTISIWNSISPVQLALRNIVLPIGISFFTFQGISYVVDVYRGDVAVQKNFGKLALYILLFPQLIAGPIVRYKDVADEIDQRSVNLTQYIEGMKVFIIGLGKKVILANALAMVVDEIWSQGAGNSTVAVAWLGSIAYTLQIYFDFWGYSEMAIGIGRMLGFTFPINFNQPYTATSITDFWRKWHITLSQWFRDYVYIPLGGNRKHVYLNLAIVFILTGVWHGASWNFVAWGIFHGIFILLERYIKKNRRTEEATPSGVKLCINKIYTLLVVNFGWVLFRADTLQDAAMYIRNMFGYLPKDKFIGLSLGWYLDRWTILLLLVGIFFATSLPKKLYEAAKKLTGGTVFQYVYNGLLIVILFISITRIVSGTYNPFIYFQF